MAPNRSQKDACLQRLLMLKQEGRGLPSLTSTGNMWIGKLKIFYALGMPTNDHKSTVIFNLGITNKFQHVGKFTNIESMHNEDGQYL